MAETAPVALITGAARRIGAEIARAFHERGFIVLLHYRNSEEEARALADNFNEARPESAVPIQANLELADQVRRLASDVLNVHGRLDVLVNNASAFYATPLGKATDDDWTALMGSNLRAPFLLTQALAPALAENGGSIVNLIDVYAERPLLHHSLYCMAKAGLASLTRSSARELGPDVRVNGVAPGPILWPEAGDEDRDAIIDATALKRSGTPVDIAGAVSWLALDAPYVTGQILSVDGGRGLTLQGG